MDERFPDEIGNARKFQVLVGDEAAEVEAISLTNSIYVVERPGHEPIFVTRIRDKRNNPCWVSIPQGDEDLAEAIGKFIEEHLSSKH